MKLSLVKILFEISKRLGPRTGALEIERHVIDALTKEIFNVITVPTERGFLKLNKNYSDIKIFRNPITGNRQSLKITVLFKQENKKQLGFHDPRLGVVLFVTPILDQQRLLTGISKDLISDLNIHKAIQAIKSVLAHEIAHALQYKNTNLNNKYTTITGPNYFNHPYETEAQLAGVVPELNDFFKRKIPFGYLSRSKPREIRDWMSRLHSIDPVEMLQHSIQWTDIAYSLTNENRKKFYKLAYEIWKQKLEEIKEIYEEAKLEEWKQHDLWIDSMANGEKITHLLMKKKMPIEKIAKYYQRTPEQILLIVRKFEEDITTQDDNPTHPSIKQLIDKEQLNDLIAARNK